MGFSRIARLFTFAATLVLLCTTVAPRCWSMSGYQYKDKVDYAVATKYTDCGTSVPVANCWLNVKNAPLLETFTVNLNNDIWGIETNGTSIVHFDSATQGWPIQPGLSGVTQLANSNTTTYALANGSVYKFNGSAWVSAFPNGPVAFTKIATGADDDFWALGQASGCGKVAYHYNGSSWVAQSQPLTSISLADAYTVYGTCGSTDYEYNGSSWGVISGSSLTLLAVAGQDRNANNGMPLIWGINSSNAPYHRNASGWDAMNGNPSYIATGGEFSTYGLFAGVLKHYSAGRVTVTYTVTGNTPCGAACENINHTTTAKLTITGYGTSTNQLVAPAPTVVNVPTSTVMNSLDSGDCLFGDQDVISACPSMSVLGTVYCPILGGFAFSSTWPVSFDIERAWTYAIAIGTPPYNCSNGFWGLGPQKCFIDTTNYCNAATTPPLMDMSAPAGVDDSPVLWNEAEWYVTGTCGRAIFSTYKGPWHCIRTHQARTLAGLGSCRPYIP